MNVQTIRERRAKLIAEMRAITEAASQQDRDLTDDESRKFDEHKGALTAISAQLERAEYIADQERRMQAVDTPRRGSDGSFERLCSEYEITRAVQAQIDPRSTDCGRELEVSQEIARRTGKTPRGMFVPYTVLHAEHRDILVSNTGANTVPNPLLADRFIEPLRVQPQVVRAGATVMDGLIGTVDIPRQITVAALTSVAEHGQVSETQATFDQVTLSPHTIGCYTEVSRRWLISSTPSGERIVRNDLTNSINVEVDRQALRGTGASNEATGLMSISGVGAVAFSGAPTWAKTLDMVAAVASANAEQGRLAFMMNAKTRAEFQKTLMATSTDSRHLTESPNELAGFPLLVSNNMAGSLISSPIVAGTALFGDWTQLILGFWSGVDILVNPYHSSVFDRGGALVSAFIDVDVQARQAAAFARGTAITLT
jgi:HK97 family phage major capsid protein